MTKSLNVMLVVQIVVVVVVVSCYWCTSCSSSSFTTVVVEAWSPSTLSSSSRSSLMTSRRQRRRQWFQQQQEVQSLSKSRSRSRSSWLKLHQRRGRSEEEDEEQHRAATFVDGNAYNHHHQRHNNNNNDFLSDRRSAILSYVTTTSAATAAVFATSSAAFAETTTAASASATTELDVAATGGGAVVVVEEDTTTNAVVEVTPSSPDARKLFNEGRALESQGNMFAAQRLYVRVTQISPRFIYGWANLANTQVALGDLGGAENNYSKAIKLCQLSNTDSSSEQPQQGFGVKKCNDLYVLLLNRGSVRLNNGQPKDALQDLQQSSILRGRPDAVIAQNLARAKEINGLYGQADKDYTMAISMTANEVNPFWLRSAMVKLQLGDLKGGKDLLARVENRFPDAPEVKAASATFQLLLQQQKDNASDSEDRDAAAAAARRKFLEIPNKQRLRFSDNDYLKQVISWPPAMIDGVTTLAKAVGDI